MNEQELARLLRGAAEPAWDDDVRAASALYAGQRLRTRRRRQGAVGAGLSLTVLAAAAVVTLLPAPSAPVTDVVLGCSPGVGTAGEGVLAAGAEGVTLAVSNPTHDVLPVRVGSATVLAVPGSSQVTLPLTAGHTTVRCGAGAPVSLTVQRTVAAPCTRVAAALGTDVERGRLDELTRARLGVLPKGAVVDASSAASPVRHVQVRSAGAVVAEAVWHEMPGEGDWHLESLSRCG